MSRSNHPRHQHQMRPQPARWFELLTTRDDLARVVEALAETGSVELENRSETSARLTLPDLQGPLDQFHRLAQRYRPYWPTTPAPCQAASGSPVDILQRALDQLARWRTEADPRIAELEELANGRGDLLLLAEALTAMGSSPLNPTLLAQAAAPLAARLLLLPPRARLSQQPPGVITVPFPTPQHQFLVAVGPPEEVESLIQSVATLKGRPLPLPAGLGASLPTARVNLARHLGEQSGREHQLHLELERLAQQFELERVLAEVERLEWFLLHVQSLPVSENFGFVTGWTDDFSGQRLEAALLAAQVDGVVGFPPPPHGKQPPMVLVNPGWARPFELFARLLGTPASAEADPSRLLALVVPLLFGYMFGDVGQGAILLLTGVLLARRWPALRILIWGGAAAMGFGALFGSCFSLELWPPLWLYPLDEPLTLLAIPLVAGALLLLTGLALGGLGAAWRGQARHWWHQEAAVMVIYAGLLLLPFQQLALLPLVGGIAWYLTGAALETRAPIAWLAKVGELLETTLQLLLNTLSFARVGAFALAHAGLSSAVVALAEAAGGGFSSLLVVVMGNGVIIALEGLVVSIQITRLVLFEFFIRFLRGEGRGFRPIAAPGRQGQGPRR